MMGRMTEERLLTVAQVMAHVGASEKTVYRWLASGELEGFQPGGTKLGWRIPEAALVRFLESRKARKGRTPNTAE
jgi:excisionase family DNA binding protein